jgi:hypothetical protein
LGGVVGAAVYMDRKTDWSGHYNHFLCQFYLSCNLYASTILNFLYAVVSLRRREGEEMKEDLQRRTLKMDFTVLLLKVAAADGE